MSKQKPAFAVLKILYIVSSPNGNIKHPAKSFLKKDEIFFQLVAIRQCKGGGVRVLYGTRLMGFGSNLQLLKVRVKLMVKSGGTLSQKRSWIDENVYTRGAAILTT